MSQLMICTSNLLVQVLNIEFECIEILLLEDFECEEEEKELEIEENEKLKKDGVALRLFDSSLKITAQNVSSSNLLETYLKEVFTPPPEL